jgi:hypothetical protein
MTLRYEQDPDTGLPRLIAPASALTEGERRAVEGKLSRCYLRLLEAEGRSVVIRINTGPTRFRVSVQRGRNSRCPTLILQELPSVPPKECRPTAQGWVAGLQREWEDLVFTRTLQDAPQAELAALVEAIDQLRRHGATNPVRLADLLLDAWLERNGRSAMVRRGKAGRRPAPSRG